MLLSSRSGLLPMFGSGGASNWWDVAGQTVVAAYLPKGAPDLATSYVNLANPGTYNAAPGVAPTLDASGWVFNGTTQYLTTGITPVRQVFSMVIALADYGTTSNGVVAGCASAVATEFAIYPRYTGNITYYSSGANSALPIAYASFTSLGIAGNVAYRNGVAVSGTIPAGSGTFSHTIYIGCSNNVGDAQRFTPASIRAIAIYSTTLSGADVAALTTRMADL